jgi:hypothetical protein
VVLERLRSGNGGHVWIFFSEPVPAEARRSGSFLITETMERCPDIGSTPTTDSFRARTPCLPVDWEI